MKNFFMFITLFFFYPFSVGFEYYTVYKDLFNYDRGYNIDCEVMEGKDDYADKGVTYTIQDNSLIIQAEAPEDKKVHGIVYRRIWDDIANDVHWKVSFDFMIGEDDLITGPEFNLTFNSEKLGTFTYGVQYYASETNPNMLHFWISTGDKADWGHKTEIPELEKGEIYSLELIIDHYQKKYNSITIKNDAKNIYNNDNLSNLTVQKEDKFNIDDVTIALEIDATQGKITYYNLCVEKEYKSEGESLSEVEINNDKTTSFLSKQDFELTIHEELYKKDFIEVVELYDQYGVNPLIKIKDYNSTQKFTLPSYSGLTAKFWYDGDESPTTSIKIRTIGNNDSKVFSFLNKSNDYISYDCVIYKLIGLKDLMEILKMLAGIPSKATLCLDINSDQRIDLKEAIYYFKKISGF